MHRRLIDDPCYASVVRLSLKNAMPDFAELNCEAFLLRSYDKCYQNRVQFIAGIYVFTRSGPQRRLLGLQTAIRPGLDAVCIGCRRASPQGRPGKLAGQSVRLKRLARIDRTAVATGP